VLNGNTFAINYKKKGFLGVYNVDIQDISFITVDGFDVRDVSFKEGTDTLVATVGGIDVNATCNAEVSGLWVIGAALEAFTLKNITVQIELATTSDNQVNWQLSEVTRLSLEDLTLTLDSRFWQRLVNKNMNLIKIVSTPVSRRSSASSTPRPPPSTPSSPPVRTSSWPSTAAR